MKKHYFQLFSIFLFCFLSIKAKAQLDTTFWFAAPDLIGVIPSGPGADRPIYLRISTAGQAAKIKISIPANPSFTIPPLNIGANSSQSIDLTAYIDLIENGLVNSVMSKGLLIESTAPISCYYDIVNTRSGDMFALKGKNALGIKFTIPFQMVFNNRGSEPNTNDFIILATENNTSIQIKPKNDLIDYAAGISFSITLKKGETYMCRAANNIPSQRPGGTVITANKPISITIKEDLLQYPGFGCADAGGDQLIADDIAGQEFIVVKGRFNTGNPDYYYVFATQNNTTVKVNNIEIKKLNAGEYYTGNLYDDACFVETSAPAHLLHVSGFGCEIGMAIIPSIKCTGSSRVNTTRALASEEFYLNIISPKSIINDFIVNNNPSLLNSGLFLPVPGTNSDWMYLRFRVDPSVAGTGANVIIENSKGKFHAGVIQGGSATTRYGYFSDFSTNTVLLSDPKNPSIALKDTTIVCYNTELKIDALNLAATSYNWIGPNGFTYAGQQLNINSFDIKNVGEYTVSSSGTGCGNASKSFVLTIDKPVADFNFITNGCENDLVSFSTSPTAGIRWVWNFGNNNLLDTLSAIIPSRKLIGAGDINISMKLASEKGCFSEPLTKIISLSSKPKATYTIPPTTCINDQIGFADASSIVIGTIKKWSWDLNNNQGIKSFTNNDPQIARYSIAGKKQVKLFVESQTGCISDTFSLASFIINPLPNPGFVVPEVCLDDALAKFIDTSKSSDGFNSFSYQWNFNAGAIPVNPGPVYSAAQTIEKNPAIKYKGTGKYLIKLIVNSRGCIDSITKTFKVNGANPVPAFEVIQPTSLCSNDSIRIKNLSTIDFDDVTRLEIYWDSQNPTTKTIDETPFVGKTYSFRYQNFQSPANKKINITLRAFSGNALSCSKEITKEIILSASPKINFNLIPGICLNANPRQIIEAIADPLVQGSFMYTGKGVDANGLFNPALAGIAIHTIKTVYKSSTTTCVDSAENTIRVWDIPKASFEVSALKCEKNKTIFTSTSVANEGSITKWIWNFGDENNPTYHTNNQPVNHIYNKWGNYDAKLQVETDKGCLSPVFKLAIKINPLPKVSFLTENFCLPNAKALFTNTSSIADGQDNLITYRWDFGDVLDPSTDLTKNGQHTYKLVGPYNVKLIATSVDNCRDSTTALFDKIFKQPKAGFISPDSICLGTSILLKDTSKIVNGQIVEWYWNLGDNTKSNVDQFNHTFTSSKEYVISHFIKTSIGCHSDTISKIISVWDYPKISAGPDLLVLNDGEKKIESSASGNHLKYKWSPSLYLSADDSLKPYIKMPQENQIYTLTVTGRGLCTSTDEMKMTALKLPKPTNTFTPNGDGINDTWEIPYLNQYTNCILEIHATTGQMLYRSIGYTKTWDGKYNGNDLPTGTYYYVIDPKNGRQKLTGYITLLR